MTLIDNISFQFKMADEQFVREFYADWDVFCQRCVTDVLEEFFSRYDKKEVYIEIDRLDLDLGGIPQEEFYDSFPVRLREALEREFVRQMKEPGGLQLSSPDGADSRVSLETEKTCCIIWNTAFACPNGMRGTSTCMRNCCISGMRIMQRGCCP